jgi:hypothetical protein
MSDPITIGAGLGAGLSVLSGKSPLKGAALGGLGGAGYGALTGSGMAGNLLSKGGVLGAGSAGTVAPGASGATQLMGTPEAISPFTPQGVLGTQTVTPGLTGAEQVLGQAGQQAMAQSAPMFTGGESMMDTVAGVSKPIEGATMGTGGYGTIDRIKDVAKESVAPLTQFAEQNPRTSQLATGIALQNMLQPQPQYQMQTPPAPTPIPSRESVSTYVPASLRTQVARNVDPRLQSLYGFGRG